METFRKFSEGASFLVPHETCSGSHCRPSIYVTVLSARLAALRRDAGLTQAELATAVGEPQQNIALWEQSDKPPRSDVIPKLAEALGVAVEDLFAHKSTPARRAGPVGKVRRLFDDVSRLPRRQQDKIVEFLTPIVEQFKKTAG